MNFKQIIYKAVVIAAFFLVSCNKKEQLGDDLYPTASISNAILSDTFSVDLSTVYTDSILANGPSSLLAGTYQDPVLGKISASSFFSPNLLNTIGINYGINPRIDSAVLVLKLTQVYGDPATTQQYNLYRLSERLVDSPRYSKDSASYEPTPIGSRSFTPAQFYNQNLTIRLPDSLGQEIINLPLSTTQSLEAFANYIKGFALVPQAGNVSSTLGFSLISNQTFLQVYYKTGANDSLSSQIFPVGSNPNNFNRIKHDKTGTLISGLTTQNQLINSSQTNHFAYLQSGTGLRLKVDFPSIKEFTKTVPENFFIVKAEIVMPLNIADTGYVKPVKFASIYEATAENKIKTDANGNTIPLYLDGHTSGASNAQTFTYFSGNDYYLINCTYYIDALVRGAKENTGLLIVPLSNQVSLNRSFMYGRNNPDARPKLKIYYTSAQ